MTSIRVRRDGFLGQHMVVLPNPVREFARTHPLLRGLCVTDCGYFPKAAGHRVERPQGSSTHLLMGCLAGRGWVQDQQLRREIKAGDLVWCPAELPHSYGADENDPWTIIWVHFRGEEVAAWRALLSWPELRGVGTLALDPEAITKLGLDQLYAWLEKGYSVPQLVACSAHLRLALSGIVGAAQRVGKNRSASERTAFVRDQIVRTAARPYRLEELATSAQLSVPHFSLLFRELTGYAPIDFLIRQRIKNACRLLDTTQSGVALIASEVGFEDPYYFSRCFKKVMGMAPKAYRSTIKA